MLEPYLVSTGRRPRTGALAIVEPHELCWRWPGSWTERAFTSIATPSATGRCATASMPSRVPSPPTRPGIADPPRPYPGHPSGRPAALRPARRGRKRSTRLGAATIAADGRPDHPLPGRGADPLAIPVRLAPARRGAARLRERLGRLDRRPAASRWRSRFAAPGSGVATHRSSCRMSASRSRLPSVPSRSARPTSTASRRRPVPSRSASWPTSSSWTATSSHRASCQPMPARCSRSSRASRSSRTRARGLTMELGPRSAGAPGSRGSMRPQATRSRVMSATVGQPRRAMAVVVSARRISTARATPASPATASA